MTDDLNRCAVDPGELRCPDYSFKLHMNPWQHPDMDKNIYHLLALVTALCNECGGVIYLTCDDPKSAVPTEVIESFQTRLVELIDRQIQDLPQRKINFTQVLLHLGRERPWAVIQLKSAGQTLKYAPLDSDRESYTSKFSVDLYSWICIEDTSDHRWHVDPASSPQTSSHEAVGPVEIAATASKMETNTSGPERKIVVNPPLYVDEDANPVVDVTSFKKLDWSKNKKDWKSYVHGETPTTEKIIESCSLWKPTKPMTVTPDKGTLKQWFSSAEDIEEMLSVIDTKGPGFAIVCKTWRFHASPVEAEPLPVGHMCDVLTVCETGKMCLWVICSDRDEQNIGKQMEYLMTTGRMIKYQLVKKGLGDLANLCIQCRLFFPNTSGHWCDAASLQLIEESLEMQRKRLIFCDDGVDFESLRAALATVILSKESPLKRPVGDQTSITLSEQQAEVLFNKDKVIYVSGAAGSGKSYTAALLCKLYGPDKSVYICTTNEFLEYLRFSGYEGTLVQRDQDLLREIKDGTFKNKTCVVIDDSHNFTCTKASMRKLFKLLRDSTEMSLFVFGDNDYQSFDRKRQREMYDCIHDLTRQVLGKTKPYCVEFDKIYRNTRKVVSFIQSAIQDTYTGHTRIECANMESGDGIECITMPNVFMNSPDNELVVYLCDLNRSERYKLTEIAVLLDPSYTTDQIEECRAILREHIPDGDVQSARVFPRRGIIVDSVNSFLGLDTPLCVCILPHTHKTKATSRQKIVNIFKKEKTGSGVGINNPRFSVFMASRATHKAVFVVPEMDAETVKQLKFDYFAVGVCYDFNFILETGSRS